MNTNWSVPSDVTVNIIAISNRDHVMDTRRLRREKFISIGINPNKESSKRQKSAFKSTCFMESEVIKDCFWRIGTISTP